MNRIVIEAVSQNAMRPPYNQEAEGGDWFFDAEGNLTVRVIGTDLDKPETFLFALHELVEAYLCRREGVSQAAVDAFDTRWKQGPDNPDYPFLPPLDDQEPGDDPAAPYRTQHRRAILIEHLMAQFIGLSDYGVVR